MIPVTKTFLPSIESYIKQVQRAYENNWLTNRGELVKELETKLTEFLNLSDYTILITNNGTIPLQIALKLLANQGEVITTPFSYVATTAAIVWENCTPIFVDIHPEYFTIDESKIEAAITSRTKCILATHVFGNPCNIEEIEKIAKRHNLKVIYDAAHCFGVKYKGKSIFEYGDISTCSFHATKLFHTGEGGAIFCRDQVLQNEINYSHNFGHKGPIDFQGLGINAKISELQAAMGLAVLPNIQLILSKRKELVQIYDNNLNKSKITKIKIRSQVDWNYSYYPILLETEEKLLEIELKLKEQNIFARRYFYPSLNKLPYVHSAKMYFAEDISVRILCLPLYVGLEIESINKCIKIINENL